MRLLWPLVEPGRPLVTGWAIEAIFAHLEAVTAGHIKRLLINVPPGFMKTLATCVFWPSWEWGPKKRPDLRYVFTGYVGALTEANNLKLRRLVESDVYQSMWGGHVKLTGDQNAKAFFENTRTGFALATSVGGVGMGKRGDRGVIDDPNNTKTIDSDAATSNVLQWYTEVHPTRINDEKTYSEVVIMQRTGDRDVSGHILSHNYGHEHLCIPMEWRQGHPHIRYFDKPTAIGWTDPRSEDGELAFPERFSRVGVEDLKQRMRSWGGAYAEAGQLDQLPIPRGGGAFKRQWFQFCEPADVPRGGRVVRAWDLAASVGPTADWTVGVKMRRVGPMVYVEDVVRIQGTAHAVDEAIMGCARQDGPGVEIHLPQDPGQAGKAQRSHHVAMLAGYIVRSSPETGAKTVRAMPLVSQAEGGNVMIVRSPWNGAYLAEIEAFPTGRNDDQVDASSRGFAALIGHAAASPEFVPEFVDVSPAYDP